MAGDQSGQHVQSDREPRRVCAATVRVRCEQWGQFVALEVDNVSDGGMFIRTATPAGLRTMVDLELPGPAGRPEALLAEVVHVVSPERGSNSPGMGVQFISVDGLALQALRALIRSGVPQAPGTGPIHPRVARPSTGGSPREGQPAVLTELRGELRRLKECGDFERLGLAPEAEPAAARRAFRQLSKRYHPDRFGRHGAEIKDFAQEIYLLLSEAEKAIRSGRVRRTTGSSAVVRGPTPASPIVRPPTPASSMAVGTHPGNGVGACQRGARSRVSADRVAAMKRRVMMSSTDHRPASVAPGRRADDISSLSTEAIHRRGLAAMREGRHAEAGELFAEAIKRAPYLVDYQVAQCLARGYLLEQRGEPQRAIAQFRRARTLDSGCEEALRRLRALGAG